MASTRSRHIRKLKQTIKHLDVSQIYYSEMGSLYEKDNPKISEACMVAYQLIDVLKSHTETLIESI